MVSGLTSYFDEPQIGQTHSGLYIKCCSDSQLVSDAFITIKFNVGDTKITK